MPLWFDAPLQQTFEELERDELRRFEATGTRVEDLLDGTCSDDPTTHLRPAPTRARPSSTTPTSRNDGELEPRRGARIPADTVLVLPRPISE
jgi:hypothetical protein